MPSVKPGLFNNVFFCLFLQENMLKALLESKDVADGVKTLKQLKPPKK
jgi:hypothetical protein